MKNFTYYRPAKVEDAVGLLDAKWGTAELLAGGTDLIDLQKEYVAQPNKVISLNGVTGFGEIKNAANGAGGYKIGAGVKLAALADHEGLRKAFPALTTAAGMIGGPQIRNMGTLGGNLCQRNRCWYFRDEHVPCLLKGGTKCFALDGENRYHAVFTQGQKCVIVNPSTLAPGLIALGATADIVGPKNASRILEIAKFFRAPTNAAEREHVLLPNELVAAVNVPDTGLTNASYEVRQKLSYDWPLVQAAVAFKLDGNAATGVKIVLGHVAPTPLVSEPAAKALEGKIINEQTAEAAGRAAAEGAKPLSQNAYKIRLIEVAVKRALLTAAGAKKYWEA